VWRCRSADVRVWRCRSADVKVWRCRSADVKVWRCRSADVKVWRCRYSRCEGVKMYYNGCFFAKNPSQALSGKIQVTSQGIIVNSKFIIGHVFMCSPTFFVFGHLLCAILLLPKRLRGAFAIGIFSCNLRQPPCGSVGFSLCDTSFGILREWPPLIHSVTLMRMITTALRRDPLSLQLGGASAAPMGLRMVRRWSMSFCNWLRKRKSANQIHVNAMEEFSEVIQEETARALRDFVLSVFTKASLC